MRHNKYHAVKTGKSASKKEAARKRELELLEMAGEISNLRCQVPFELIPMQKINGKCVERSCKYVADFVYLDKHGRQIVEDTKGFRTKDYIIKRKLMLFRYGIRVKEV